MYPHPHEGGGERTMPAVRQPSPASSLRSSPPGVLDIVRSSLAGAGHKEYRTAGRIVMTEDGRSIRSILTGRHRRVTGSYASRKAGCGQVFESMNEYAFYQLCEVDTRVVDYRAQPFRFELVVDGVRRIYIPDCARMLDDGAIEIVELKGDDRQLRDPDYRSKLEGAEALCDLLGWRFKIITRDRLLADPVLRANVLMVEQDRMARFDDTHVYAALEAIDAGGGEAAFQAVADQVAAHPLGAALVRAMMAARVVQIDLSRPLGPTSTVRRVVIAGGAPCLL